MEEGAIINGADAVRAAARDPLTRLALAMLVGVTLGHALTMPRVWLGAATVLMVAAAWMAARDRPRAARHWAWLVVLVLSAAWLGIRAHHVPPHHLSRFITDDAQLAEVTGVVEAVPWLRSKERGAFGPFNWEPPVTLAILDVTSVAVEGRPQAAEGKLLLRVGEADHRLALGQVIRARGWLGGFDGPVNPGETDYRARMMRRGLAGRLSLDRRDNWTLLAASDGSVLRRLQRLREQAAAAADRALSLGLADQPLQLGLLRTLLLGRWSQALADVEEDFRRVGLAHILSISGAHLAILMGLVWALLRLVVPSPAWASRGALVILLLYLMVLPATVPILRSAIMTGTFCIGFGTGRRVTGMQCLALSCILVLLWRPMDLFLPGFQLSFGIVVALILFAQPVSHWLWPPPVVAVQVRSVAHELGRRTVDYLAVSLVAFVVALPLVCYHFQMISPHAVLLSVLSLPVITALLGLGYLKILLGLLLPSGSIVLSGPLAWITDSMLSLVSHSAGWPGAAIELGRPPSLLWTLAALAAVIAILGGWFARRRAAVACTGGLLTLWLTLGQLAPSPPRGGAVLHMFAVGDGSCYLLQVDDYTLMFDCGSAAFMDVGEKSIVPSLRRLGIRHLDTLVISHADLDHFSGSVDVADAITIGRVLVSPQLLREASTTPDGATAFLVDELRSRGVTIEAVAAGWSQRLGEAELELLWPPRDLETRWNNDVSLVLSARIAGRRLLLNGDIQQAAIQSLLASGIDLRADVMDLPHHGSFVDDSPRWLAAVGPQVVLQSSGRARLRHDKWADTLADQPIHRFITARDGKVTARIEADGQIEVETFLKAQRVPIPSR